MEHRQSYMCLYHDLKHIEHFSSIFRAHLKHISSIFGAYYEAQTNSVFLTCIYEYERTVIVLLTFKKVSETCSKKASDLLQLCSRYASDVLENTHS
jgi:hypothetical protein